MTDEGMQDADASQNFGFNIPWPVKRFTVRTEHVPEIDQKFRLDPGVARMLLMGFAHGRRVYLYGPPGSGKTSHIEQVAARLNWPCLRINLDGHVSRADLIGRDMIVLKGGKQVTQFQPGLLTWAVEQPIALILDEYDAGRPDVMFVLQRLLESDGKLTLLDQNRVVEPHPGFRLFATANTAGQGDFSGMYAGTHSINQAQMDRWDIVIETGYPDEKNEIEILSARFPDLKNEDLRAMASVAKLCRQAFKAGDLSCLFSLRVLLNLAGSFSVLEDIAEAFEVTFMNRLDPVERGIAAEIFQRCFGLAVKRERSFETLY